MLYCRFRNPLHEERLKSFGKTLFTYLDMVKIPILEGAHKLPDQQKTLLIEIPPDVVQQEIWNIAEKLEQVEGVTSELQEPRHSLLQLCSSYICCPHLGQLAAIGGGMKATHDIAKIIYDFLHRQRNKKPVSRAKSKW